MGSSNGIKQLETASGTSACTSPNQTIPVDYARSSRAIGSGDCKGLNVVAYAVDGVPWFHYTEVNGHATPSAAVTKMSQALLADAYAGTLQCWNDPVVAAGSGTPTFTYSTSGCKPIVLYTAQAGSGTRNTWDSYVGTSSSTYLSTLNGQSFSIQKSDGTTGTETYNSNDHVILENEDREIITVGDEANALFYFSYGKFNVTCKKALCGQITGHTGVTKELLGKDGERCGVDEVDPVWIGSPDDVVRDGLLRSDPLRVQLLRERLQRQHPAGELQHAQLRQ